VIHDKTRKATDKHHQTHTDSKVELVSVFESYVKRNGNAGCRSRKSRGAEGGGA